MFSTLLLNIPILEHSTNLPSFQLSPQPFKHRNTSIWDQITKCNYSTMLQWLIPIVEAKECFQGMAYGIKFKIKVLTESIQLCKLKCTFLQILKNYTVWLCEQKTGLKFLHFIKTY